MFRGTTLRGMLLNAYAFWKIGQIALWGAIAAFIGAGILLTPGHPGIRPPAPDGSAGRGAPEADRHRAGDDSLT